MILVHLELIDSGEALSHDLAAFLRSHCLLGIYRLDGRLHLWSGCLQKEMVEPPSDRHTFCLLKLSLLRRLVWLSNCATSQLSRASSKCSNCSSKFVRANYNFRYLGCSNCAFSSFSRNSSFSHSCCTSDGLACSGCSSNSLSRSNCASKSSCTVYSNCALKKEG